MEAWPQLSRRGDLQILHLTGRGEHATVVNAAAAREHGAAANHHIYAYLDDMEFALAAADLAVCRAGSSGLAEAAARGLPMIIVPYPHAAAHQEANARPFADAGAALIIADEDLTGRKLADTVEELLDAPRKLGEMSEAAAAVARADAASQIAQIALEVLERRDGGVRGDG